MTRNPKLTIRRARAEDAPFLARIILLSGRAHVERGIWEVILDRPEQEVLEFLEEITIAEPPHLFHYSCFIIAEEDSAPVAGLGGYDPGTKGYDKLRIALEKVQIKRGYDPKDAETDVRAQKVLSCLPKIVDRAWIIDSVATLPGFRRKGISEELLKRIMEIGYAEGYETIQVNIYIGNIPARRAYEKLGFTLHEEVRSPAFMEEIGSPGMASMTT